MGSEAEYYHFIYLFICKLDRFICFSVHAAVEDKKQAQ